MKICRKCGENKQHSEFSYRNNKPIGRCKACVLEDKKEYRARSADKIYEYNKAYRIANPDKSSAWTRKYRQANKDKVNVWRENRRALEGLGLPTNTWEILSEKYGRKCAACGTVEELTLDHVIPLSWGGSNELENIQILCAFHNYSKGNRHATDYRIG